MNGSMNLGICYKKDSASDDMLMVLSDNDYANDQAYRRSTYGYVFILSGGEVVWILKNQPMSPFQHSIQSLFLQLIVFVKRRWREKCLKGYNTNKIHLLSYTMLACLQLN